MGILLGNLLLGRLDSRNCRIVELELLGLGSQCYRLGNHWHQLRSWGLLLGRVAVVAVVVAVAVVVGGFHCRQLVDFQLLSNRRDFHQSFGIVGWVRGRQLESQGQKRMEKQQHLGCLRLG